jgi:hypothetical protein
MNINEIRDLVAGNIVIDNADASVNAAYASDLLSDVMGHCGDESVLVTIQNHLNTIAVCTLVGVEVIVICHNRPVPDDMAEAAKREGVGIVVTPLSQYAASTALSTLKPSVK